MSASSPRRKRTRPDESEPSSDAKDESVPSSNAKDEGKTSSRQSTAVEAWVASVVEEKPVGYIVQNLERAYGLPVNKWSGWDVLDMLVSVIHSQATSDVNSDRT